MFCLESGCIMGSLLSSVPNFDAEDLVQKFEERKLSATLMSFLYLEM